MSPTYITVRLPYLEENLCKMKSKKYSNNKKHNLLDHEKDNLDDCFIFWKGL